MVGFSQSGKVLIDDIYKLLETFGISVKGPYMGGHYKTVKYGDPNIRKWWIIVICKQDNLKLFKECVGFSIIEKMYKLYKILNNYKHQEQFDDWRKSVFSIIEKTYSKKGFFISKDLVKETKRSNTRVRYYLKTLLREHKIEIIEHHKMIYGGRTFTKYVPNANTVL